MAKDTTTTTTTATVKRKPFIIDPHELMIAYVEFISTYENPYWTNYQPEKDGPVQEGFHETCKKLFEYQAAAAPKKARNPENKDIALSLSGLKSRITRLLKKQVSDNPSEIGDQGDDVVAFFFDRKITKQPKPIVVPKPDVRWDEVFARAIELNVGRLHRVDVADQRPPPKKR